MPSSVIIVTNCTNRKRAVGEMVALGEAAFKGSLEDVARRWTQVLKKARPVDQAHRVYGGRSIFAAKTAASLIGAPLYIVSAGLGLVHESEPIPAYDFTVAPGANSIAPFLNHVGKTPADWWHLLTSELGPDRSVRSLIENNNDKLILFALPSGYLELIAADLGSLTPQQAQRIRILTSRLGETLVPSLLRPLVLPYDERLEGLANYAGTRTDFPQRALLHFVKELNGHLHDYQSARTAVLTEMAGLQKPVLPTREKKSDDEITALLRQNWNAYNGASGRLLRFLRDDALVACEQSRFRQLWLQVQQEFETRG